MKPVYLNAIEEIFKEDEDYLILRSLHCYNHDAPDLEPDERFSVIFKAVIIKRFDLHVDLDKEQVVEQKEE